MSKQLENVYSWDKMPKYIQWNKSKSTTIYFAPLVFKKENEHDPDAYVAMYARESFRTTGLSFRMKDYLFRVEAPTLDEVLRKFGERFHTLQEKEIIQGRLLIPGKIESDYRELINEELYYQTRDQYRRNWLKLHHRVTTCLAFLIAFVVASCTSPTTGGNNPDEPSNPGNPNKPVKAEFVYTIQQPMTVVLTNKSENAGSYRWTFGDGESSTERNPTHRYQKKGVYEIKLTASNNKGQQSAYATVKVEEPTRIYISGFTVSKIPYENQYYRIKVIDDDFFTTTWVETDYKLLSSVNVPYTANLTTPVLLNGIDEDNYYIMQLYYNTKNSGTGTKVAAYKMTKEQILQYPEKLTGTSDNVSLTTYFSYK